MATPASVTGTTCARNPTDPQLQCSLVEQWPMETYTLSWLREAQVGGSVHLYLRDGYRPGLHDIQTKKKSDLHNHASVNSGNSKNEAFFF